MNLGRHHLVRAHERTKESADDLCKAIATMGRQSECDSYFADAVKQLQEAARELGFKLVPVTRQEPLDEADLETVKSYLANWTPPA